MKRYFILGLLLLALNTPSARADTTATFQLTATCSVGIVWNGGPCAGQTVTGTFTLDRTTGALTNWDFYSAASGRHYNSAGTGYCGQFNCKDSGAIDLETGTFGIGFERSYETPGNPPGYNYDANFTFGVSFIGDPQTFSGGPIISGGESGYDFADYTNMNVNYGSGSATLVGTTEPTALLFASFGLSLLIILNTKSLRSARIF